MNPRITKKERNLIKLAVGRVFSRSELRREVIEESIVDHYDARRKRVTKWSRCSQCKQFIPTYLMQVDHIEPVVPINKPFENMTLDELEARSWCEKSNLNPLCKPCHQVKSSIEMKLRRKEKKKNE